MHEPRVFTVSIPPSEVMLYRLITNPDVGADDYRANGMIEGKERLWPKFGEDWVTFLAISTFEHDWQAVSLAQSVNERIARRGDGPRWTHVQAFYVNGHRGVNLPLAREDSMAAASYMILDIDSGNSVGTFHDRGRAVRCLRDMAADSPKRADSIALVTFDEKGSALLTELAEDVAQLVG